MNCSNCGNVINKNDKYCRICGTKQKNKNDSDIMLLALLSLILFFPIISIPLAIISIVKAVEYNKKNNTKTKALIIGIISLIINVLVIVITLLTIMFIITRFNDEDNNIINEIKEEIVEKFNIEEYTWIDEDELSYTFSNNRYRITKDDIEYKFGKYEIFNEVDAIKRISDNKEEYEMNIKEIYKYIDQYDEKNIFLLELTQNSNNENKYDYDNVEKYSYLGIYNWKLQQITLIDLNKEKDISLKNDSLEHKIENNIA